jgi:hypothetical protein
MRENLIAGVLFVLALLFGIFPNTFVLRYMDRTVEKQVDDLTDWTRTVEATSNDERGVGADQEELTSHEKPELNATDAPQQPLLSDRGVYQSERKARS